MSRSLEWMLHLHSVAESHSFEAATRDPIAAQEKALRTLITMNARTAFGRAHGFAQISNPNDYAHAVPIADYESLRPYINRIAAGEKDVLTADDPDMFTTTSGTTDEPKLIPVTARWRAQMEAMTRLWLARAMRDHPGCLTHKALTIVSPAVDGVTPSGMPYGAMSGITYLHIPWIVRRHYALPYAVALIPDYQARYFISMRLAMAQCVSMIATPNPSTLLRLARIAEANSDKIIGAIRDGVLGIDEPRVWSYGAIAGDAIHELRSALKPNRERARFLEKVMKRTGRLLPRDVWPELRLIGCWLGGSVGFQANQLTEYYGDLPRRDLGLWASEGRMTIPIEDNTSSGVLAVHSNFYEFIPEENTQDNAKEAQPRTMLAHQLERGRRYYIVISGANGLYRYNMNDIVEVTGFYHQTPQIAFVRKGGDMASITGEKIHLNQVQLAIKRAEAATSAGVHQFRIIPDLTRSRYDLLVEFSRDGGEFVHRENFANEFDRALSKLNCEYASKRASERLGPPLLWVMRDGWSDRISGEEFRLGKRESQYKWRQLALEWDPISRAQVADLSHPALSLAS